MLLLVALLTILTSGAVLAHALAYLNSQRHRCECVARCVLPRPGAGITGQRQQSRHSSVDVVVQRMTSHASKRAQSTHAVRLKAEGRKEGSEVNKLA